MQFQFKRKIGNTEFTFVETADSHVDFVEKASFFSSLPTLGPNGEDDLKLVHRTTTQGYNYYSIVSEKANMEYKFGQSQQKPGTLYGKGWEELYKGEEEGQVVNGGGIGQQPGLQQLPNQNGIGQQPVQQMQQPVQQPQVQNAQPIQQPQPQNVQPVQNQPVQNQQVNMQNLPQNPPNQQQPVQQPVQNTQQNAANQQVATDVLAQFGIN